MGRERMRPPITADHADCLNLSRPHCLGINEYIRTAQYYLRPQQPLRLRFCSTRITGMSTTSGTTFKRRIEGTPRRVRVLFNKKFVADTTAAKFVWEHPYYPNYYLPAKDVQTKYLEKVERLDNGEGHVCRLTIGNRTANNVLWYENGDLSGLVKFQFKEMGESRSISKLFLTFRLLV